LAAAWGDLELALKAWGWSYKTAKFPHTWEWGLQFKPDKKTAGGAEAAAIAAAYHRSLPPPHRRFYNDPSPSRTDDASPALRQHLAEHPPLWALVVRGSAEGASPEAKARTWADAFAASRCAQVAAGEAAAGSEAKAAAEEPPAKRSRRS
jgi:hypothetical protein